MEQHDNLFAAVLHAPHGRHLMATTRIGGIGVGVLVLGAFLIFCVTLCAFGSKARRPGLIYTLSAIIFAVVALVLLCSPKGYESPPAPQGHDATVVPLIVLCTLMSVGVLASLGGTMAFSLRTNIYARPLSYDADVLRQY